MEKEPRAQSAKLTEVVARDYPSAEISVSFPDDWEVVDMIRSKKAHLYIAALPLSRERPSRNQFEGLAPEINVSLVFYRLYRCFQPWPMPTVNVAWDGRAREGRVTSSGDLKVQLQSVGQAQAWFGVAYAVLWECYFHTTHRMPNGRARLSRFWQIVERDINAPKIFTLAHEPTFDVGYMDFLTSLRYAPDPDNQPWWSKDTRLERESRTGFNLSP